MTVERPLVLVVSSSDQQRETLAIMLDRDFEIATASAGNAVSMPLRSPAAVVLAAPEWSDDVVVAAQSRWPAAPLVMVDPPPAVRAACPSAGIVSWSDPHSVRPAVIAAVGDRSTHRTERETSLTGWCMQVGGLFVQTLRPHLRVSRTLAALAQVVSEPTSAYVALRILREQVEALSEHLAWIDELESEATAVGEVDLGALLRQQIEAYAGRFQRRGLTVDWRIEGELIVRGPRDLALCIGTCVRGALLRLARGAVVIRVEPGRLTCGNDWIDAPSTSVDLLVAQRLLAHLHARLEIEHGHFSVWSTEP